jgi:hypothetical protein
MADYVKHDKFGNPYKNVKCKPKEGRDVTFYNGYVEITKNGLYQISPGEELDDEGNRWVRVKKMDDKRKRASF